MLYRPRPRRSPPSRPKTRIRRAKSFTDFSPCSQKIRIHDVIQAAAQALAAVAHKDKDQAGEVIQRLLPLLTKDQNSHVIQAAAQALGAVAPKDKDQAGEVIHGLLPLLTKYQKSNVIQAAAQALGAAAQTGKDQAGEVIHGLLPLLTNDQNSHVIQAAAQALAAVAPKDEDQAGEVIHELLPLLTTTRIHMLYRPRPGRSAPSRSKTRIRRAKSFTDFSPCSQDQIFRCYTGRGPGARRRRAQRQGSGGRSHSRTSPLAHKRP